MQWLVKREPYNYNFTLRENFTIADDSQPNPDAKATEALQTAYAHDILEKAKKGMDTSHRLSNVVLADRILVLEKGRLVEDAHRKNCCGTKTGTRNCLGYQKEKYILP